jgi:hypothetical protein
LELGVLPVQPEDIFFLRCLRFAHLAWALVGWRTLLQLRPSHGSVRGRRETFQFSNPSMELSVQGVFLQEVLKKAESPFQITPLLKESPHSPESREVIWIDVEDRPKGIFGLLNVSLIQVKPGGDHVSRG